MTSNKERGRPKKSFDRVIDKIQDNLEEDWVGTILVQDGEARLISLKTISNYQVEGFLRELMNNPFSKQEEYEIPEEEEYYGDMEKLRADLKIRKKFHKAAYIG